MEFRTVINIEKRVDFLNHNHKLLALGSCFSQNVGGYLENEGFDIIYDQFGTLFNPLSIARNIQNALTGSGDADLILKRGVQYYHYDLPTSFSGSTRPELLELIDQNQQKFHERIKSADRLILTFGTAWAYRLKKTGDIVANCHKMPHSFFEKELLNLDDLKAVYTALFQDLKALNPKLEILLTVSPVRHKKDGLIENNRGKSVLLLLTDYLCGAFDFVNYFPAYELVIDDLRDYRFFKIDMVHPTEQAIAYVYEKLRDTYFSEKTAALAKLYGKLSRLNTHKVSDKINEEELEKMRTRASKLQNEIDRLKV